MRRILFWVHLCAGVAAGLVILIMSVTGVLLAYERQILDWANRAYRSVPPAPNAARLSMDALLARVREVRPGRPGSVSLRSDPTAPVEVGFGREHVLLVNPYTGAVLGEGATGARAFFATVTGLHRWLGAKRENMAAGRAITGACNFAFLFLVVSGFYLWWPKQWNWRHLRPVTLFRGGLGGRARDWNWHNVIGFWCALPLFWVVLTGVVMSYPWANNLLYRITGSTLERREGSPQEGARREGGRREGGRRDARPAEPDTDRLWNRAQQQVPGWRSITLRSMGPSGPTLSFSIDESDGGRPDTRSQLILDRKTGAVVRWERFEGYSLGRQVRSWFRWIHTGEAGGLLGQTIAAIASAGAVVLVWTGIALALRRLYAWWRRRNTQVPELEEVAQEQN